MRDYSGQKYHKLTFVKAIEKSKNYKMIWELRCDCGETITSRYDHIISGKTRSCGCFRKQNTAKMKRKYDPIISSAREVYNRSYSDNKLGFDKFFELSQKNCHYCGCPPQQTFNVGRKRSSSDQRRYGNFIYNGLDRLDSSLGHSEDNVVPCCWTCNYMKRKLSVNEFKIHIEKIFNNWILSKMG